MKKTALAISVAGAIGITGAVVPLASATAGLHASVDNTHPKVGDTVKLTYSGARKNETTYVCIYTLTPPSGKLGKNDSNPSNFTFETSNAKGRGSCQLAFVKFTNTIKGTNHSCPPTKKDRRHGWGCGMAIADSAHRTEYKVVKLFR
jgi:hypothetical protein